MAATVVENIGHPAPVAATVDLNDDDDAWLYGGDDKKEDEKNDSTVMGEGLSVDAAPFVPKNVDEDGEMKQPATEEDEVEKIDDVEDSDDDDDVQVTIGDIKTGPLEQRNLFKGGTRYQAATVAVQKKPQESSKSGADLDAVGTINSVPIYEYDLSSIEDKAWNKPGADITDYFNYGFNEATWSAYCEKQTKLRAENHAPIGTKSTDFAAKTIVNPSNPNLVSVFVPGPRKFRPHISSGGTISVIGGSSSNSRRPNIEDFNPVNIPVTGSNYENAPLPPGVEPSGVAVPNFNQPPPTGVHPPPPGTTTPPPGSAESYDENEYYFERVPPPVISSANGNFQPMGPPPDAFYGGPPPPAMVPPPDRGPMPPFYGAPPPNFIHPPQFSGPPPHWEKRSPGRESPVRDWDFNKSRSPGWSSGSEEDVRYRRDRERDRDYDRDRSSYRRDRDTSDSRSKERERDRDRDRKHRDRPEREHKRSRKHEDSDEERRRRHKKSKRSKREKDDSSGGGESNKDPSLPPE
ncbi:uncharacterized protein LOC141905289 [Tubulanus polymorphus]|uniref:uncharacterized protein LOC141905289 n=1 Tax=Tubulanus polymorphus TaxID=672921 RepID=UPI003DA50685